MKGKASRKVAKETFRQFAWNLAGTIAASKSGGNAVAKPAEKHP